VHSYGQTRAATKKAKCEDCGKEVTWTAWYGDNNALPTASGHYYLADDMLGKATTIAASATVVLDLNGHTIKTDGASRLISMNNGKNTFVLMDTSEGKTGTIVAAHGVGAVNGAFVWANKGSFKMYGGIKHIHYESINFAPGILTMHDNSVKIIKL